MSGFAEDVGGEVAVTDVDVTDDFVVKSVVLAKNPGGLGIDSGFVELWLSWGLRIAVVGPRRRTRSMSITIKVVP